MSDLRKAAEQAYEMLGHCTPDKRYGDDYLEREFAELNAVRRALRAALAESEQAEPYIYLDPDTGETWTVGAIEDGCRHVDGLIALYAATPAQTPPRLTDEQIHGIYDQLAKQEPYSVAVTRRNVVRAIEQAHGITGGKT